MTDEPHVLNYNATINRMEPGIAPVSADISLASIAMSLKRLVDLTESEHFGNSNSVKGMRLETAIDRVVMAINNHSSKIIVPR